MERNRTLGSILQPPPCPSTQLCTHLRQRDGPLQGALGDSAGPGEARGERPCRPGQATKQPPSSPAVNASESPSSPAPGSAPRRRFPSQAGRRPASGCGQRSSHRARRGRTRTTPPPDHYPLEGPLLGRVPAGPLSALPAAPGSRRPGPARPSPADRTAADRTAAPSSAAAPPLPRQHPAAPRVTWAQHRGRRAHAHCPPRPFARVRRPGGRYLLPPARMRPGATSLPGAGGRTSAVTPRWAGLGSAGLEEQLIFRGKRSPAGSGASTASRGSRRRLS